MSIEKHLAVLVASLVGAIGFLLFLLALLSLLAIPLAAGMILESTIGRGTGFELLR